MSAAVDYMNRYLNISWTYGRRLYPAVVSRYLSAVKGTYQYERALKACKQLDQAMPSELRAGHHKNGMPKFKSNFTIKDAPFSFTDHDIEMTFRGKASPDAIRKTLWLCMHFGLIQQYESTEGPQMPGEFPVSHSEFARNYLGTDCSGFVNCFLGRRSGHKKITEYDQIAKTRRKTIEEIEEGDILVVKGGGHIAVVERTALADKVKEHYKVFIVESNGHEGLGVTDKQPRTIKLVDKEEGLFFQVGSEKKKNGPIYYHFLAPEDITAGDPVP